MNYDILSSTLDKCISVKFPFIITCILISFELFYLICPIIQQRTFSTTLVWGLTYSPCRFWILLLILLFDYTCKTILLMCGELAKILHTSAFRYSISTRLYSQHSYLHLHKVSYVRNSLLTRQGMLNFSVWIQL
jgi:hypothetical protein